MGHESLSGPDLMRGWIRERNTTRGRQPPFHEIWIEIPDDHFEKLMAQGYLEHCLAKKAANVHQPLY